MAVRSIACDPCRRAKTACGHERPTCSQCRHRGQSDLCGYRAHPFRRNQRAKSKREVVAARPHDMSRTLPSLPINPLDDREEGPGATSLTRSYPNPGYLGTSSHSNIFNELFSSTTPHVVATDAGDVGHPSTVPQTSIQEWDLSKNASFLVEGFDKLEITQLTCLVRHWLEKGVNLPLAERLVAQCSEAVLNWRNTTMFSRADSDSCSDTSHRVNVLLRNTQRPIIIRQDSGFESFQDQIGGKDLRLEAIGIFLTAAARATLDIDFFPTLFTNDKQRHALIKTLSILGDSCLETCLALDCLNDLQLILQYENFILHSQVDGDQSYRAWRRMGDLASSLFALGYHERIDESSHNIPTFLAELRRACFARIYTADKSLAIFLGRPPRIVKEYCCFQLPGFSAIEDSQDTPVSNPVTQLNSSGTNNMPLTGRSGHIEPINYTADTRCAASFASLKEEILLMLRRRHSNGKEQISELRARIQQQWHDLPNRFRLAGNLRDQECSPFERDFLAGTRLDYLHTLLLLGLVTQRRASDVDSFLLEVAGEMLSITVEVIILRDRLVNSGSCLIWKYGLAAAGIVSLALLNPMAADFEPFLVSKMIQDLSALVAEITIGAWIQSGDPNFALFGRATRAIRSLLDCITTWRAQPDPNGPSQSSNNEMASLTEDWNAFIDSQPWDFEMDFWASLAEHPSLLDTQ